MNETNENMDNYKEPSIEQLKNKKSKGPIIVIIILILIIIGLGTFIYIKKDLIFNDNKVNNSEQITNNNNKDGSNDNGSTNDNQTTNGSDKQENNIEQLKFDPNSVINETLNNSKNYKEISPKTEENIVIKRLDNKTIQLEILWDSLLSKYGYQLSEIKYVKDHYKTINFNKELKEIYFYDQGQGVGAQVLLFLMDDGTVEYMMIERAIKNNQFISQGVLPDVKDVIKFYTVDYGTYYNVWAQRSDGKTYSLGVIIDKIYLNN